MAETQPIGFREAPDAAVRARALDTASSFLVQAPAGSGKTELLTQRYLKLLAEVEEPERILAITFTRKAVAEMRNRIVEALRRAARQAEPAAPHEQLTWRLACQVLARDQERGWGLVENPSRLRVQTIDALCQALVSQTPWLSRMGGPVAVTKEPERLYQEAARRAIQQVEQGEGPEQEALARLLLHLDNRFGQLAEALAEMLARREQWVGLLGQEPDRSAMEEVTRAIVRKELAVLRHITPVSVVGLANFAASNMEGLERWRGLQELPATDDLAAWEQLAAWLLTKEGKLRKTVTKNQGFPAQEREKKLQMIALLETNAESEFAQRLADLESLPPVAISDEEWAITTAARVALQRAHLELQGLFAERREVDFAEYALRALVSLDPEAGSAELAERLFYRTEHILVDEFQDTSRSQVELLRRMTSEWSLGDGRTLFAVGDPMQSIYLFRGAEVGLFLHAEREGIGDVKLQRLRLAANFRSRSALVEWCNQVMPRVLAEEADEATGAVPHEPSVAMRQQDEVSHVLVPGGPAEAAQCVAEQWQQGGHTTMAVLVRNRQHAREVAAQLKQRQVPFAAVEIEALAERAAIGDLLALTRAMCFAADRTAWLAVLRAPWCGLTLAELHALTQPAKLAEDSGEEGRGAWDKDAPVLQLLGRLQLPPEREARVARVREVLQRAWAQRGTASLRSRVRQVWLELGGPATLQGPQEMADVDSYFALLSQAEEAGDLPDLERFTQQLTQLLASSAPESIEGRSPVQIMTMHKSKGLEFDVVVLPELHRRAQGERTPLLVWRSEQGQLLLSAVAETGKRQQPKLTAHLMAFHRQKLEHELGRLLYVAATRAKNKLVLVGQLKENGAAEGGSLLARLRPALTEEWPAGASEAPKAEIAAMPARGPLLRRFAADFTLPPPPPPVVPMVEAEASTGAARGEDEEAAFAFWDSDRLVRRAVGIVAHQMMESFAREGLQAWQESRLVATRPAWMRALQAEGVAPERLEEALVRLEALVQQVRRSQRAAWILGPHREARSELELTAVVGKTRKVLRLDRTFLDEEGVRWVVDFKTGEAEDVERELSRYRQQLNTYGAALRELGAARVMAGLYFVAKEEWRQWEVAASTTLTPSLPAGSGIAPAES